MRTASMAGGLRGLLLAAGACGAFGALVACGTTKKQPPPAAGPLIDAAHQLAERVCACQTDKDCLHGARDEWDAQKEQLLGNGGRLVGDDKTKFDAEIQRIKMCGDGGGLTFWDH